MPEKPFYPPTLRGGIPSQQIQKVRVSVDYAISLIFLSGLEFYLFPASLLLFVCLFLELRWARMDLPLTWPGLVENPEIRCATAPDCGEAAAALAPISQSR